MTRKPKLKPVRCWMIGRGRKKSIEILWSAAYGKKFICGETVIPGHFVPDKKAKVQRGKAK